MYVIVTGPQASVAVGVPTAGTLLHCTVTFAGTNVNVGEPTSTLFTVKVQEAVVLQPSVAVSVSVIGPVPLTVVPTVGDCISVGVLQLSEAVANIV